MENQPTHPALSSILVFDNDCADVYLNNENPTLYKPIGIDILERLIPVLNSISRGLSAEIVSYNTPKPVLDQHLNNTPTGRWYDNLESKTREEIDGYILLSPIELARKQELFSLINSQNPQQIINDLSSKRIRIENYLRQFLMIEERFNNQAIGEIRALKNQYEAIGKAYEIATKELEGLNTMQGFGSNPWRTLWDAAKNFAISAGMTKGQDYPSNGSLERCVLCQQYLDTSAKERLLGFSRFIINDVSSQLNVIQREIEEKLTLYNTFIIPPIENFMELNLLIVDFQNRLSEFTNSINILKNTIITYLQTGGELNVLINLISPLITNLLSNIDNQIEQNQELINNRNLLNDEYNELCAREFILNNRAIVLRYYDEYKYKSWISTCQDQLNTAIISRKIGEIMEEQAVMLQHQEFINHLSSFNQDLSSKVVIYKTRTSLGSTYQKCGLYGISQTIDAVLSEGEKKVIALSNFFAECTIDNRKNTVVFDDPVNSLDMDYRETIAKKIVELSRERQIIVFTHELSFLRMLIDTHKAITSTDCHIIGIDKYNGVSGIVTDEIPYLAKNVDERVDSIRRILREHDALPITDAHGRDIKLDSARKRFRMLLERSVEEVLANKTYERFSKNIHFQKGYLSSFIVVEQSDIDFLLALYGRYSVNEHDGGTSTISQLPNKNAIEQDIRDYMNWKNDFRSKHRTLVQTYN